MEQNLVSILDLSPAILERVVDSINFGANKETMAILVNLVTKYSGHDQSERLLLALLRKFYELSANVEKRSSLASVGAIEAALGALIMHINAPDIVNAWLTFTLYLSLSDDPQVASRQFTAGVAEQLATILELYINNPVVLRNAMLATGNLASASPEARAYLTTAGRAFSTIAAIMDCHPSHMEVTRWACYATKWLAHSNRDNNHLAAQAGIPVRIVRAIRTFGDAAPQLLNHSLMTIGNLSYACPKCQAEIFVSGALEMVLSLLRAILPPGNGPVGPDSDVDEDTVVCLCYAINNTSSGYYNVQEYLLREGALPLLVRVLKLFPTSPRIVENAFFAISTIACNFYISQTEIGRLNAVSAILHAGYVNRNSLTVQTALFLVLGNVSGDSDSIKLEIARSGGLDVMVAALEAFPTHKELCARASRAIEFVLSIDETYAGYASETVVAAVRTAAEHHPNLPELRNCLLSITRSQDPVIVAAVAEGKCSATVNPQCPGMCPYRRGKFYCPVCAKPQYTYFCVDCSIETKTTLRLCPVCAEHHLKEHPKHELLKTFMSRRCYCTKCINKETSENKK